MSAIVTGSMAPIHDIVMSRNHGRSARGLAMASFFKIAAGLFIVAALGAGIYLWTPAAKPFDREAAIVAANAYDARIIRDRFGVPHIYGARDADVAFGLAYAHAEDDMPTIAETIRFTRSTLGQQKGKEGGRHGFPHRGARRATPC